VTERTLVPTQLTALPVVTAERSTSRWKVTEIWRLPWSCSVGKATMDYLQ